MDKKAVIFFRIQKVASSVFGIPAKKVLPTSSGKTISSWDSLAHLNFVMELESEFGITFSMSEISPLTTINSVYQAVCKHLS